MNIKRRDMVVDGVVVDVRTEVEIMPTSYSLIGLRQLIEALEAAEADMIAVARERLRATGAAETERDEEERTAWEFMVDRDDMFRGGIG